MNTKFFLMFSVLLLPFRYANADDSGFKEILTIPWGYRVGEAGNRWHPSGNFGPADFTVVQNASTQTPDSILYLLDGENRSIAVFSLRDGIEINRHTIPAHCQRFTVKNREIVLWDGVSILWSDPDTERITRTKGTLSVRIVDRIMWQGECPVILDEHYRSYAIQKHGSDINLSPVPSQYPRIEKSHGNSFLLTENGGDPLFVEYPHELGSVEYIGSMDSVLCVVVERKTLQVPISVRESIVFLGRDGTICHSIDLPFVYYTDFPRRIQLIGSKIYVFVSAPAGLSLYSADVDCVIRKETIFPEMSSKPYHFNWHVPCNTVETNNKNTCHIHPISRDSVMCMARRYVDLEWVATDENITDEIERMPDGTYVRTPAWVRPGELMNVPYKWGGFTSIDDFTTGVELGKKCGDDYLESMGHSDEYCIGVDCSGFVSRCWGMEEKYFTATMHEISHELPSYSFLERGDALNKPHHHIRLVAEDMPSGMILTIEAGGEWRVCYHLCKHTSLVGYTPIRFNGIVDDVTRDPFIITVSDPGQEVPVMKGPSTQEGYITSIQAPMRFVSTAYHKGWYHFHLPTGTGVYGGWCYGGEEAGDGHIEGYQEGMILTLVGETLNAYSGPGYEYAYVTTVSPGQRYSVFAEEAGWYGIYIANVPHDPTGWIYSGWAGEQIELIAGGPHDGYGAEILTFDYPPEISEGDVDTCLLRLKNIGSCSWNSETMIRTTVPRGRSSLFASSDWIDSSTINGMEHAVLPHQVSTIFFEISAPYVFHDSLFTESFGIVQNNFGWFGDTGQFGPGDSTLAMRIHVKEIGLPEAPTIDLSNASVENGIFRFSWEPVNTATHYGVFRGLFGSDHAPNRISITDGLGFSDSTGLNDSKRDVFYRVKAYCPCDSSDLSNHVGEFEFAREKPRKRTSDAP